MESCVDADHKGIRVGEQDIAGVEVSQPLKSVLEGALEQIALTLITSSKDTWIQVAGAFGTP